MEELKKLTKVEIINLILQISPKLKKCRLWGYTKERLINGYIKLMDKKGLIGDENEKN